MNEIDAAADAMPVELTGPYIWSAPDWIVTASAMVLGIVVALHAVFLWHAVWMGSKEAEKHLSSMVAASILLFVVGVFWGVFFWVAVSLGWIG